MGKLIVIEGTDGSGKSTQFKSRTCCRSGRAAAEYYGQNIISCAKDGTLRSIEHIHEEIYRLVAECLEV